MSEKEAKKPTKPSEANEAPIKAVSVFLSLENCEGFIDKQNRIDRMALMRKEGLEYIKETDFVYHKCSCLGCLVSKQES